MLTNYVCTTFGNNHLILLLLLLIFFRRFLLLFLYILSKLLCFDCCILSVVRITLCYFSFASVSVHQIKRWKQKKIRKWKKWWYCSVYKEYWIAYDTSIHKDSTHNINSKRWEIHTIACVLYFSYGIQCEFNDAQAI